MPHIQLWELTCWDQLNQVPWGGVMLKYCLLKELGQPRNKLGRTYGTPAHSFPVTPGLGQILLEQLSGFESRNQRLWPSAWK